jgi:hypothetical protein
LGSLKTTEKVTLAPDATVGVKDTIEGGEVGAGFIGNTAVDGHREALPAYWAVT